MENKLGAELHTALSSMQDFSFKAENGFVTWNYKNTDTGTISFPIGSKEFMQLESDIIGANLKTFEDLETFLYWYGENIW